MRKLRITQRTIFTIFIWSIITVAEYFVLKSIPDYTGEGMGIVSIVLIVNLFLQIVTMWNNDIPLVSFFPAFILCYYIMHFGQVFMLGFFPNYQYDYVNYISVYMSSSPDLLAQTLVDSIICINAFFIGGVMVNPTSFSFINDNDNLNIGNLPVPKAGTLMYYLLLPFRLYIDGRSVLAAFYGGYRGAFSLSGVGVFSALANMWYVALTLHYLEIESKREKKTFAVTNIIYLCVTMLSGNRGHAVVAIISFLIIANIDRNKKIGLKRTILIIVLSIVGLNFIDIVFSLRQYSISYFFDNFNAIINQSLSTNIILESIGTFGETIFTPFLVNKGIANNTVNPFFGECFVKSLASIVPDVFGWFKNINNEAIFAKMLGTSHTIGGSFVGEMIYNFGGLYPFMSLIIGYIYAKASSKIACEVKSGQYRRTLAPIVFCSLSLWWVRDSIGGITREFVWFLIMYFICERLTFKHNNR